MPPKITKKKKRRKRKSKAELEAERLAKEEEERKLQEEEEKRLEEERKRQEEEDRKTREKHHAFRVEEIDRLIDEINESRPELESQIKLLHFREKIENEKKNWSKYIECETKPDTTSILQLNSYLSIHENEKLEGINDTFCACAEALELGYYVILSRNELNVQGNNSKANEFQEVLKRLWSYINNNLDNMTLDILNQWEDYLDDENNEVMLSKGLAGIRYGLWVNASQKSFRLKMLNFSDVGILTDIPKTLGPHPISIRNMFVPFDYITPSVDNNNYNNNNNNNNELPSHIYPVNNHIVLGGIYKLELLGLPPSTKEVRGWTIKTITPSVTSLTPLNYPLGSHDIATLALSPPFKCNLTIPDHIILMEGEKIIIAWWNSNENQWETDGINEAVWNSTTRSLKFHTVRIGNFALIQDCLKDLPYIRWSLTPIYKPNFDDLDSNNNNIEEVYFTIETPRLSIIISIKGVECRLIEPQLSELESLRSHSFSASTLLTHLKSSGINLMPDNNDNERLRENNNISLKNIELENYLYNEISLLSAAFDFQDNAWNSKIDYSKSVFSMRESSVFTGGRETFDYSTILTELDDHSKSALNAPDVESLPSPGIKCSMIKATNEECIQNQPFNDNVIDGTTTHVHLFRLIRSFCTEEAYERALNSDPRFRKTIKELLQLVRPFSFG